MYIYELNEKDTHILNLNIQIEKLNKKLHDEKLDKDLKFKEMNKMVNDLQLKIENK